METRQLDANDLSRDQFLTALKDDQDLFLDIVQRRGPNYYFSYYFYEIEESENRLKFCLDSITAILNKVEKCSDDEFSNWHKVNQPQLERCLDAFNEFHGLKLQLKSSEFKMYPNNSTDMSWNDFVATVKKERKRILYEYKQSLDVIDSTLPAHIHEQKTQPEEMPTEPMPLIGTPLNKGIEQKGLVYVDNKIFRAYTLQSHLEKEIPLSQYDTYKIHLGISIDAYRKYLNIVLEILEKAVKDGVIDEFKVINTQIIPTYIMKETLSSLKSESEYNPLAQRFLSNNTRSFNNSVTIIIPNSPDMIRIAQLCLILESTLLQCPIASGSLSKADLSLSTHVSFRQETIEGIYEKVDENNIDKMNQLQQQGLASPVYQNLVNYIGSYRLLLLENLQELKKEVDDEKLNTASGFLLFKKMPDGISRLRSSLNIFLDEKTDVSNLLICLKECSNILNEKKTSPNSKKQYEILYNKWKPICNDLLDIPATCKKIDQRKVDFNIKQ